MNAADPIRAESTRMFMEASAASQAVRAQLEQDAASIDSIGAELRRLAPRAVSPALAAAPIMPQPMPNT